MVNKVLSLGFVNQPNTNELALAMEGDFKSEEETDKSRRFFKEDGTNSEFLNGVLGFLSQFQNDALATKKLKHLSKKKKENICDKMPYHL